jgi:DNA-binding phage protein
MALTKSYKETLHARLRKDPKFRDGLLREAIELLLAGEVDVAKVVLRDYINATIGFETLGAKVKISPKSLMRMFGPKGNPQAKNLFAVISALQKDAGIDLHIAAE